MSAEVLVVRRS